MKLDRTHNRILTLLQKDARMSAAAIGRAIGLSRPAVQDRISAMEKAGIIKGYHASIQQDQASAVEALMFLKISKRPCEKALNWLEAREEITAVLSLSGDIDAVVSVRVPNAADLSLLSDRILASGYFSSLTTQLVLYRSNDV